MQSAPLHYYNPREDMVFPAWRRFPVKMTGSEKLKVYNVQATGVTEVEQVINITGMKYLHLNESNAKNRTMKEKRHFLSVVTI